MKISIQGNKRFSDYGTFRKAMATVLYQLKLKEQKEIVVFSAGPQSITNMAKEFFNISEDSLRAYGVKHKIILVPPKWIRENLSELDELVYFASPREAVPQILEVADKKGYRTIVYHQQ